MKIFAISVLSLLVVLAVAGCNPVGMDKTRVYITGFIYTDTTENTGAEGIGVATTSENYQETHVTQTNVNGLFWIEIQFYPEMKEGGTSGSITFGVKAFDIGDNIYYYGGDEAFEFTVFGGDTLRMYDINLDMFKPAKSGGR
ncbi:MAG: hypothetical protein K8S24_06765 [Candidatus Aegiribacteria sp.]|nr:hypothetical protein [Candidatus Aegiribacteria sp.]